MKYWIWFTRIKIKPYTKYKLIQKYKNPEIIYNLSKKELIKQEIETEEIQEILNKTYKQNLEIYEQYLLKNKIELITLFDKNYPQNLKNIYDPPIALYLKGNKKVLNTKSIGIVGCRLCSKYGEYQAKKISYDLAKKNITIVSGLAKGIDKYSHIGCMSAKGKTIAVLGNGLDIMYPYENLEVARKIIKTGGAIISEYIIGTKPNKINFPQRNRIISGISQAVIVVEAKIRSGSMITVDYAIEQGKDIYAVPGNITSKNSGGTNELIKQGAIMLTDVNDIIL